MIKPTRRMNSAVSDVSFKRETLLWMTSCENKVLKPVLSSGAAEGGQALPEQEFEYEFTAVKSNHEKSATGQGPSACGKSSPAFGVSANKEAGKH